MSGFRVGIVGTGFIARRAHIPAWNSLPGAEVAALCDSDPAALAAAARESGAPHRFTDYRDLLDTDVRAVSVCTPNALHFPVAMAALEAGKHVLCEKPLGISAAEARALGEKADAAGLVLMTQHQLRFGGPALAARECLRAGRVGTVYHARARALRRDAVPTMRGFTERELAGGGAAMDLGIHVLDMALWLMGFPRPVRVSGSARVTLAREGRIPGRWGEWDRERFSVEDFAAGLVHFEDGSTLALESAWLGHHAEEGLGCVLLGTEAGLHWPSARLVSQGAEYREEALAVPPAGDPHHAAVRAFHDAVVAGSPSPVPWRETFASLAIVEALYRSAREGREAGIAPPGLSPAAGSPSGTPA